MEQIVFYVFGALAILGAIGVPALRNPVHSALSLAGTFISLAALYVLLNAPFIAAAQVMIYAGAILILFLFVTMVLNPRLEIGEGRLPGLRPLAVLFTLALVVEIAVVFAGATIAPTRGPDTPAAVQQIGHTQAIGVKLFTSFLLPFEITSLILLIAIVGAMVMARQTKEETAAPAPPAPVAESKPAVAEVAPPTTG